MVDAGGFLSNDRTVHGELRGGAMVRNKWVLKAYDQFKVDVANVSGEDLGALSSMVDKNRDDLGGLRFLERLVLANVAVGPRSLSPKPFKVVEVAARAGKPVRIAFVGLASVKDVPLEARLTDPVESAKRVIPEAKKRSDLVVVLAHMKLDEAMRLAREAQGIDLLIAGAGELFVPPTRVGQTPVVFSTLETRMLGEVRFYRDSGGSFFAKERYISLDDAIPDDPAAAELVASQRKDYNAVVALGSQLKNSPSAGDKYVGAQTCATCHKTQYIAWANSAHAQATNPVLARPAESDSSCLSCHATRPSAEVQALSSVQCERCHGPGAGHSAKPAPGYGRIADKGSSCLACHTRAASPRFDLQSYWTRMKH